MIPPSCTFVGFNEYDHLLVDCSNQQYLSIPTISIYGINSLNNIAVDLSENNFAVLDALSFESNEQDDIVALNLTSCNIQTVDDDAFYTLENHLIALDLSRNHLKVVPRGINSLKSLQYLALRWNIIEEIPTNSFSQLRNLTHLSLSHCEIRSIARGAFMGLEKLSHLWLDHNTIKQFSQTIFGGLIVLDYLNLKGNYMIALDHCHSKSDDEDVHNMFIKDDDLSFINCQCHGEGINVHMDCILSREARVVDGVLVPVINSNQEKKREICISMNQFVCGGEIKGCEMIADIDGNTKIKFVTKKEDMKREIVEEVYHQHIFMLEVTDN